MVSTLVTGASGYIGGRLVPELLAAGHSVRCLARTPSKLDIETWRDDVEVAEGDVTDAATLVDALAGIDVAYFLVHSIGGADDFAAKDHEAAETFRDACGKAGVGRIVYLGGLGRDDDPDLSHHLESRHEVGRTLASGTVPVTELRAALIIGSGSASFEMLRHLVDVLPAMTTPKWVDNRCQPIAIADILTWLVDSAEEPDDVNHVREVGGPEAHRYRDLMQIYAEEAGLRRRFIMPVPVLTPWLSALWVGLVTPLPPALARPLIESLVNEVVVTETPDRTPKGLRPTPFRQAVAAALRRGPELEVTTASSDEEVSSRAAADRRPSDPEWSGGAVFTDTQMLTTSASVDHLWSAISRIGGDQGWYGTTAAWRLRGHVDQLLGGPGPRTGQVPDGTPEVGDAIESWRVAASEPGRRLRLRTEMKLPGEAWIEWRIADRGPSRKLVQRVVFVPKGLFGRIYGYVERPVDLLLYRRLAAGVVAEAERLASGRS
jgi:uncharacterized protein YbjT (DUF2867 family)